MGEKTVRLFTNPWVSDTVAEAYYGPVKVEMFLPDLLDKKEDLRTRKARWTQLKLNLRHAVKEEVRRLGGNALVGMEVSVDPFSQMNDQPGVLMTAVGTATKLSYKKSRG